MPGRFTSKRSLIRYTLKRMALASAIAIWVTFGISILIHGTDPNATVPVKHTMWIGVTFAAVLSLSMSGIFGYRSARLLQKLDLARAEYLDLSRTDPLTGLLNRRGFEIVARDQLLAANEQGVSTAALMCDIDHFKSINDEYGHESGDVALVRMGQILRDVGADQEMLICRYGGEEFVILMHDAEWFAASQFAEKIRAACASQPILAQRGSFGITVSVGISVTEGSDLQDLIVEADTALYAAKTAGRNRISRFPQTAA